MISENEYLYMFALNKITSQHSYPL